MNILIDGQTLETPEVNRGIGIYFKNTLNNMVKMSFCHNWYIAVSSAEAASRHQGRRICPMLGFLQNGRFYQCR